MDQDPQRGALMSKQSPRVKSVRRRHEWGIWIPAKNQEVAEFMAEHMRSCEPSPFRYVEAVVRRLPMLPATRKET